MHTFKTQRYSLCPKNKRNYFRKTMRMRTCTLLQDVTCWAGFLVNTYGFIHSSAVQTKKKNFLMVRRHIFMARLFLSRKCMNSYMQCQLQNIFGLVCFPCFFHAEQGKLPMSLHFYRSYVGIEINSFKSKSRHVSLWIVLITEACWPFPAAFHSLPEHKGRTRNDRTSCCHKLRYFSCGLPSPLPDVPSLA